VKKNTLHPLLTHNHLCYVNDCYVNDFMYVFVMYSRTCLIHHLKALEKCDDLGQVTNYANRWKLYHSSL